MLSLTVHKNNKNLKYTSTRRPKFQYRPINSPLCLKFKAVVKTSTLIVQYKFHSIVQEENKDTLKRNVNI
jgi:hypothetical protein